MAYENRGNALIGVRARGSGSVWAPIRHLSTGDISGDLQADEVAGRGLHQWNGWQCYPLV